MCVACSLSSDPSQFIQTVVNWATALSPVLGYSIVRIYTFFQKSIRSKKAPYILGALYACTHSIVGGIIAMMNAVAWEQGTSTPTGVIWIVYALIVCGSIWYAKRRYPWIRQWYVQLLGGALFAVVGLLCIGVLSYTQHTIEVRIFVEAIYMSAHIGAFTLPAWIGIAIGCDVWRGNNRLSTG